MSSCPFLRAVFSPGFCMGTRACSVALAVALSVWAGRDVKDAKHLLSPLLTLVSPGYIPMGGLKSPMMQVPHGVWRAPPGTLARSSLYPGSSPRSSRLLAPRTPALGPLPRLPVVVPWTKGSSWLQARPPTIPLSGFNRSPNSSAAHVTGPCLRRGS